MSVGDRIGASLSTLSVRQRLAIVLCHFQHLSNIEAADSMGISVEALESVLSRARRAMRAELADLVD
jgi:RNA polymerase sigma-70 factor (ECF subfamily)